MVQGVKLVLFLLILVVPLPSFAEESSALTVTTMGAHLYPRQDSESKFITILERGEKLQPLAQGVGSEAWYMVKSSKGLIGWVQATDVSGSIRLDETFKDSVSVIRPMGPQDTSTRNAILSECLKRADTGFEDTWEEHCKLHGFRSTCTVLPNRVADSLKRDRRSAREECLRLYAASQESKK